LLSKGEKQMARRFVDLSVPIRAGIASDPPGMCPEIDYLDHYRTSGLATKLFPGLDPKKDLPEGQWLAVEQLKLSTHNGTHVDAPWHYHTTMNGGEAAATIEELPLAWFFGAGVKLDFRDKPDGYLCTADDVRAALARISYDLKPFDIVLMNTSAGGNYGQPGYFERGCGFGRDATSFLLEQGVRVVGTDAWNWDVPLSAMVKRYRESGDISIINEGHKVGRDVGYSQIEKLGNLELLPPTGFLVCCFPVSIHKASAGWTRAVAILED
jgi:kynurenine formamidase